MPVAKKTVKKNGQANETRSAKTQPSKPKTRAIKYGEISASIHSKDWPEGPITCELAKEWLGWREETSDVKFGQDYLLKHNDKKIKCLNNEHNRPFYDSNYQKLMQEILRRRWQFNGEPIIIGKTGIILNGQHTLVALVLAVAEWEANPEQYPEWKSAPTIDKLVVYGVEETDNVVNTMDTCKPRSLADVIYRAKYFRDQERSAHRKLATMASNAVNMLWARCGKGHLAFKISKTHSEMIAALDSHPKLLAAIKHIYEEDNNEGKIKQYVQPGYAAAFLYLMGTSGSDPKAYYGTDSPSEKLLDFTNWDKACSFFVELAAGSTKMEALREAAVDMIEHGCFNNLERCALIAKAWAAYLDTGAIEDSDLKLDFIVQNGERLLTETPLFGGIDVGEDGLVEEPTVEAIADGKADEKSKRESTRSEGKKANIRDSKGYRKNDEVWLHNTLEEPTFVTLTSDPYKCKDGVVRVMVDTPDGPMEVDLPNLSLSQYEMTTPMDKP